MQIWRKRESKRERERETEKERERGERESLSGRRKRVEKFFLNISNCQSFLAIPKAN